MDRLIKSEKTKFTRMCIGEAVISLLSETDLHHLTVLAIVKKAGVSRMTFYNYYTSPQDALEDYLSIIIAEYLKSLEGEADASFLTYEHILKALNFFDQYRIFFLTMYEQGLYHILINSVNSFMDKYMQTKKTVSMYKKYSYAGSLLNCFLLWEANNKADTAEDVARNIYELYGFYSE